MKVRRYIVDNMSEALSQIRIELGKDAIILSHRKIRQKGLKGLLGKKQLEVTAAVENDKGSNDSDNMIQNSKANESAGSMNFSESLRVMKDAIKQHSEKNEDVEEVTSGELDITEIYRNKVKDKIGTEKKAEENESILKELSELKGMINSMSKEGDRQTVIQDTSALEDLDINKKYYTNFLDKIENMSSEEALKVIKKEIEDSVEHIPFPEKGKIVLAGPTGVGKTTTIAKIAGKYALKGNKKVGLITIDTYRIGAVEQLKTYAEIMNIPIKVVFNLKEMDEALEELKHCDVVLVDTTGRSSKNNMQVSELRSYISRVETENIFLVVSSTTKNRDLSTIINGFKSVNYNGIIMTKLDETSTYGVIYNAVMEAEKPISLVTVGQNVPDDIRDAKTDFIAQLITGEATI